MKQMIPTVIDVISYTTNSYMFIDVNMIEFLIN